MSTPPRNEITAKYEEEKLRVQEQSQLIYLQNQIDELRRLIKEQTNKYSWAMEQVRKVEASNAQLQGVIDRQQQDNQLVHEAYKRELSALRRDVSNALVRAEEAVKPIRDIQATVHQFGENRRVDREQVAPLFGRIDEVERRQKEMQPHLHEATDRYRQVVTQLEQLRLADMEALEEMRVLSDELQAEKQALRRQAIEAQQMVSDARNSLQAPVARIKHLEEQYKGLDAMVRVIPGSVEEVAKVLPGIKEDVRRVEIISTERFMMTQERIEELRHQNEERLIDLRDTDEEHLRHLTGWLERLDAWCREEEGRVGRLSNRLDLLIQRHEGRIADAENQGVQILEHLATTWNNLLEARRAQDVERREVVPGGDQRT
jgi:chromosome segregation ATPase